MNLPEEVVEAARAGRCVVFLGSSASREAAALAGAPCPPAEDLARELLSRAPRTAPGAGAAPSLLEAAASFEAAHGREALVALLQERLAAAGVAPTAAHRAALAVSPIVFTTCWDDLLLRCAAGSGRPPRVIERGEAVPAPDPERPALYRLRGGFDAPASLVLTRADLRARPLGEDGGLRGLLRGAAALLAGYGAGDEELQVLWDDLCALHGENLPRCWLAAAGGRVNDLQWERWVRRGVLPFTAEPALCLAALQQEAHA